MDVAQIIFISDLLRKLASPDLIKLARSEGISSELDKWKNSLFQIQDDVLDDLATEVIRRKEARSRSRSSSSSSSSSSSDKVLKMFPTLRTIFTPPHTIKYGRKMTSKLDEISTGLNDLVGLQKSLGLVVKDVGRPIRQLEETPLALYHDDDDDSKVIIGREGDKQALLGMLLGKEQPTNENFSTISIVGMGGIGKTTLARALFDDYKVMDHFDIMAWVCVSDPFDVYSISKTIFQSIDGRNIDFADLFLLQVALRDKLSGKRFLFVLDDVWSEDVRKWELLQRPLVVGAHGSKIVVTTRSTRVASVMNSFQTYCLEVLPKEDAMSLFTRYALGGRNFDSHPSFESYGKRIVDKCGGLPLALRMIGSLLRKKTHHEWGEVLNSERWNLHNGSGILSALKLSYLDLPPHLKRLFAYCSLFSKDDMFDMNELVLLWMAEGFLNGSKSMERLGRKYFKELESRSFFQPSTKEQSRYVMHDLIRDLATSVASDFFLRMDDTMDMYDMNFEKIHHVSFIGKSYGTYRRFKELPKARHLRTFLALPVSLDQSLHCLSDYDVVELLPRLPFLRVLSLSHHSITKIPESIGSLKHMRYLNFSKTCIKRLPEQVCHLHNLQSLLVRGCRELSSLPVSFVKLVNLRHFDNSDTPRLNKMPLGIGGLTSLQTLPKVIIEEANGFKISELKGLSDLQGRLSIRGLDKVKDQIQVKDANLQQKQGLDILELRWSRVFDDSRDETIEYDVLGGLRPHDELKNLEILFYGGMKFPSWVGDPSFDQLREVTLCGCRSCTHLPTLGRLGSLEVLRLDDMRRLEKWSSSVGGNSGTGGSFRRLHEIYIRGCPKLYDVSIGLIPSLGVLNIEGCSQEVLGGLLGVSSSIIRLTIRNIKGLTQLHGEVLEHLGKLETLWIKGCDELKYLWESESEACKFLKSLRKLEVSCCEMLVSLGEKEVNLGVNMESVREVILYGCKTLKSYNCPNRVERLEIWDCGSMTSLTFSELPSSLKFLHMGRCDSLRSFLKGSFVHLRTLKIEYCNHLESFAFEGLQSLASLEELEIHDCPSIDYSFPSGLWPPKLRTLRIGSLNKPLLAWGLQSYPTSLVHLRLYGENSGVVSFAAEAEEVKNSSDTTSSVFFLPPSLSVLEIDGFEDLESVSKCLQHLTCLEKFYIRSCPKLKDLPEPTSTLTVSVIDGQDGTKLSVPRLAQHGTEQEFTVPRLVRHGTGQKLGQGTSRALSLQQLVLQLTIACDTSTLTSTRATFCTCFAGQVMLDFQHLDPKNSCIAQVYGAAHKMSLSNGHTTELTSYIYSDYNVQIVFMEIWQM
ncbi:hypothetical protein OSB04_014587 [Centaurea solstitialis]|uniref:Uncharacterized protein n=1 Tax=Centaurea solstitialis TaxID=347529 RepID=A0AA38TFN5_9ASTR|nr:hypothetical protein OSB04_014587 [Centaurea solstitialis]